MTLEEIIKQWRKEAGIGAYTQNSCVVFHVDKKNIYIITSYPGLMIGFHGLLADKYKEILKAEGYNHDIEFIDVRGDVKGF